MTEAPMAINRFYLNLILQAGKYERLVPVSKITGRGFVVNSEGNPFSKVLDVPTL